MPAETARLSNWRREVVVATVQAYRRATGEGLTDWQAGPLTRAAYLGAGGDPEAANTAIPAIIGAAARDYPDWFWRPAHAYADRRDRYMRSIGMWPPPLNWNAWPKPPDEFK
jgi:peptidoglycan/xylan/chitin deacetylase (PgdA/CDA1 family)